jgi:2-polyprenyl-6-methoxyphenol hydroxylase-like FAD-dependent oxidoreductase
MRDSIDVLICGAGAAGLTLAIDLARRGIAFRLIEKLPSPFQGSRGKGIQPRTQEVFEDLGLLDRAMATGGVYPPVRKYAADGSFVDQQMVGSDHPPTPAEPYQLPLMVPQFLTEKLMRERLLELGGAVAFGVELTGFVSTDAGVEVTVRTGQHEEVIHARYLVGCDGGRSFVRSTLGIDFPGKTLGIRAMVADVILEGLSRDVLHQFDGGEGKHLSLCPLAGTGLFQIQGPIPLEGDIDLSADALTHRVAVATGREDIMVRSVSWASAYTMNARLADRYRDGRVFLAGDAAHTHPPTGGQGLNTSVQDAYNLGWKLAAVLRGAPESLLDTYEAERRPIAAEMLGLSTRLLEGFKKGDNRRGREVQQLDLGYAESSLSLSSAVVSQLAPGSRAPDASVRGAGGSIARLFHLFKGTHWTLLVSGRASFAPRRGMHIHQIGSGLEFDDHLGQFAEFYGVPDGAAILIRPDGYVAGVFAAAQSAALHCYLDGVLPVNETDAVRSSLCSA